MKICKSCAQRLVGYYEKRFIMKHDFNKNPCQMQLSENNICGNSSEYTVILP